MTFYKNHFDLKKKKHLFIWMHQVLVAACGDLVP